MRELTLIFTGTIAGAAVCRLVEERREALVKRFPSFFSEHAGSEAVWHAACGSACLPPHSCSGEQGDSIQRGLMYAEHAGCGAAPCAFREGRDARELLHRLRPGLRDAEREGLREEYRRREAGRKTWAPLLRDDSATVLLEAGERGAMAALWDMCGLFGCGCDVDIRKIPIRQETVEICEYCDCNPYEAPSCGVLLVADPCPLELLSAFAEAGIAAAPVGALVPGRKKILRCAGCVRCLDRPGDGVVEP